LEIDGVEDGITACYDAFALPEHSARRRPDGGTGAATVHRIRRRNAMRDKTLACGEEQNTTSPSWEECAAKESVVTENPFGTF
jgi:hypothetical protein